MTSKNAHNQPFVIKDCALAAIATGKRAQNLKELHDNLLTIHPGSIYYHFWGGLLRPRFDDPEYNNDFASWARHGLHDAVLAERLSVIDPTHARDIEDLRQEVVDVVEERLDEVAWIPWSKPDRQFHFNRSQIVVFDTHCRIEEPKELSIMLPNISASSVFYHFIDARRRTPHGMNDFCEWLSGFNGMYDDLCAELCAIDPYFVTLTELRRQLACLFESYFKQGKKRQVR